MESTALWEHDSNRRLHHFPKGRPGGLECIIIDAAVQGNKGALLFGKSPFVRFVPCLQL